MSIEGLFVYSLTFKVNKQNSDVDGCSRIFLPFEYKNIQAINVFLSLYGLALKESSFSNILFYF